MKRINPFCEQFVKIKKRRQEKILKKLWKHSCHPNVVYECFNKCWWNGNFPEDFIDYYISPYEIWDRYNNQEGLEIFDFASDMKYIENMPDDYKEQNQIIEHVNKMIEEEEFYQKTYYHYYLCEFE